MAARISWKYIAVRLVASLFVIWAIASVVFIMLKALPGDYLSVVASPSSFESEGTVELLRQRYGLDEPLWKQYLIMVSNYMTFDFGYSFSSNNPVIDEIAYHLPRTFVLFGVALTLNFVMGVLAGIHFGWIRGSLTDKTGYVTGLTVFSIPFFWLAWMLLLIFGYGTFAFQWFPTSAMTTKGVNVFTSVDLLLNVLHHMALPVAAFVIIGWAPTMLVMRTSMQEVLGEEYVETARAKGLSPTTVKYKHASRNALIPVTTQSFIAAAFLLDGSILIETVFNWPGMGLLLINSIQQNDFPVMMAVFFLLGVTIVVIRFVTDIAYTYLDPRIQFGEQA